jgi:mono/diheme cytochrome c family protein
MCWRLVAAARRAAAPWILLTFGLSLAGGPGPARAEDESPSLQRRAATMRLPARCSRCHDADGTGRSSSADFREIPDFSNHKWQDSRSDAELLVSILDGKGTHMPGFRGRVADDEARALVASVRSFSQAARVGRADSAAPNEFDRRFRELQEELEDLKKQFREVSTPRRKP